MGRFNFTREQETAFNLLYDLARDDYESQLAEANASAENGVVFTKKDLEENLRDTLSKKFFGGLNLKKQGDMYKAFRRMGNNPQFYEIIEESVETGIGEDYPNIPFIEQFVEFKNRALGDDTAFYSEGGLVSVASFAGNHWDTKRDTIDVGQEITLPKEWIYCHVYTDLERFMLGIVTLEKLLDKVYKSVSKFISERLYAQFANLAGAIPSDFIKQGNDEVALGTAVDLVKAAGGYDSVIIAGTSAALRKIAGIIPDKMFANSQKEAKALKGDIGTWEGNKLFPVPQALKAGTFDFVLDDSQVYIFGDTGDFKPIKFELIGDTRTEMDTTGQKHNDQSVNYQVQIKVGMGLVVPPYCGMFKIA